MTRRQFLNETARLEARLTNIDKMQKLEFAIIIDCQEDERYVIATHMRRYLSLSREAQQTIRLLNHHYDSSESLELTASMMEEPS